jgi:protein O-mannosyl-transferase
MRCGVNILGGGPGGPYGRLRGLIGGLFLCCLAVVPFLPSVSQERLWDDAHYVFDNPPVADRDRGLGRIWSGEFLMDYYPVAQTAIWIEYGLFEGDARGFRLANILWHAIGACAVWWAARAWRLPAAWWLAALWAVHPVHVDAVAWISQHKATVAAVFFAVAAATFAHGLRASMGPRGADGRWQGWYALAIACHAAGCLSKTDAVMLPPLLTILEVWWWTRVTGDSRPLAIRLPAIARRQLPLYAVSAAAAVVAMKFMRERTLQAPLDLGPPLERALDACWAICFYLGDVFWPANLAAAYPVGDLQPGDAAAWIWPGLIAGLAAAGWLVRRRDQGATLAALAAFVSLLVPVLFVVPQGFFQYSLVADRYLHLPLLAPVAVVAAGLAAVDRVRVGGRLRAVLGWVAPGWVIGAALLAVLGVITWRHAADYRNERAMWGAAIVAQPQAWYPFFGLGAHLLLDCHDAAAAIAPLEESCRRKPGFAKGHFVAGLALAPTRPADARRHLADAIAVEPEYVLAWLAMGECCVRLGDIDGATRVYTHAARWANATRRAKIELLRIQLQTGSREAILAAGEDLARAASMLQTQRYAAVEGIAGDGFEQALAQALVRFAMVGDSQAAADAVGRAFAAAADLASTPLDAARVQAWTAEAERTAESHVAGIDAAAVARRLRSLSAAHPDERTVIQELAIAQRIASESLRPSGPPAKTSGKPSGRAGMRN